MLHSAEDHFYRALTLAALGRSPRLVRRADARFRKWASQCAENFSHKSHLLAGEVARAAGDTARALAEFDRAEAAARQHGYVHMEGLAGQLAARLLEHLGRAEDADRARRRAVEAYRRWGAGAYAAEMERGGGH
jgi:ATP/maltotriose-dependent transcriptional regulator MalT